MKIFFSGASHFYDGVVVSWYWEGIRFLAGVDTFIPLCKTLEVCYGYRAPGSWIIVVPTGLAGAAGLMSSLYQK